MFSYSINEALFGMSLELITELKQNRSFSFSAGSVQPEALRTNIAIVQIIWAAFPNTSSNLMAKFPNRKCNIKLRLLVLMGENCINDKKRTVSMENFQLTKTVTTDKTKTNRKKQHRDEIAIPFPDLIIRFPCYFCRIA